MKIFQGFRRPSVHPFSRSPNIDHQPGPASAKAATRRQLRPAQSARRHRAAVPHHHHPGLALGPAQGFSSAHGRVHPDETLRGCRVEQPSPHPPPSPARDRAPGAGRPGPGIHPGRPGSGGSAGGTPLLVPEPAAGMPARHRAVDAADGIAQAQRVDGECAATLFPAGGAELAPRRVRLDGHRSHVQGRAGAGHARLRPAPADPRRRGRPAGEQCRGPGGNRAGAGRHVAQSADARAPGPQRPVARAQRVSHLQPGQPLAAPARHRRFPRQAGGK